MRPARIPFESPNAFVLSKKPYFIATVFSLVLVVFLSSFVFNKLANINRVELDKLTQEIAPLQEKEQQFERAKKALAATHTEAAQYAGWIQERYYWAEVLTELHTILVQVESDTADKPGNRYDPHTA